MTRSYKHTPVVGMTTAESDRGYKKMRASRERARERELIAHGEWDALEHELVPWEVWDTDKDGKMWFDPDEYPELMRK